MRLWSIHPSYLDRKGLLAVWREGLLAMKVLQGKTKGYRKHPQLIRFINSKYPLEAIKAYLYQIFLESKRRGYKFDRSKIRPLVLKKIIPVNSCQLDFEFNHLLKKLEIRDCDAFSIAKRVMKIKANPIFKVVTGAVEKWEKSS